MGEGGVSREGWSPSRSGGNLLVRRRWGFLGRLVSPKERREPLDGRRWGFPGRLVSPGEWREPPNGKKLGFPLGSKRSLMARRRLVPWEPWEGNLPRGANKTSRWGEGGFPKKKNLLWGDITTGDNDVPKD